MFTLSDLLQEPSWRLLSSTSTTDHQIWTPSSAPLTPRILTSCFPTSASLVLTNGRVRRCGTRPCTQLVADTTAVEPMCSWQHLPSHPCGRQWTLVFLFMIIINRKCIWGWYVVWSNYWRYICMYVFVWPGCRCTSSLHIYKIVVCDNCWQTMGNGLFVHMH